MLVFVHSFDFGSEITISSLRFLNYGNILVDRRNISNFLPQLFRRFLNFFRKSFVQEQPHVRIAKVQTLFYSKLQYYIADKLNSKAKYLQ